MYRISVEMVNKAATELIENPPLPRCTTGITPLSGYTSFELGDCRGKINASFSMPGFYKKLAQLSSDTSSDKDGLTNMRFETNGATGQHIIMKRCEITSSRAMERTWKNAVELWHKSVPLFMPVCFMVRDKGPQSITGAFMLFQKKTAWANNIVEHPGETLGEIAILTCKLHNNGFHILGSPGKNFRLDDKGMVILNGLEGLFKIPLPPLAREYLWSNELRRLFHSLTFTKTEREKFFTIYAQALNSPGVLKNWIARQTGIVFLDEDTLS
jgi:hypothetical protein